MGILNTGYVLGQYRTAARIVSSAGQVANSRLFVIRNAHSSNFIVPLRVRVKLLQGIAGTAQENSIDMYKLTNFTVLDTTNTSTPAVDSLKTSMPGPSAQVRALNTNVAGMTGGTSTKGGLQATVPFNVAAAVGSLMGPFDLIDPTQEMFPTVLAPNEGLLLESSILNVISFGINWYVELMFAEMSNYYAA